MKAAFAAALAILAIPAATAAQPLRWQPDCVGRMEVMIPDRVDVSAHTFANFRARLDSSKPGHPQAEFRDGETAWHGAHSWYDGSVVVSQQLIDAEWETLRANGLTVREESTRRSKSLPPAVVGMALPAPAALRRADGVTWGLRAYGALLRVGEHAVLWRSAGGIQASVTTFVAMDEGLVKRGLHEVPTTSGVCLPFAFITDRDSTVRKISTTYRSQDHPDVQIAIEDASAAEPTAGMNSRVLDPEPVMAGHWDQLLTQAREIQPAWTPAGRPVTIAGYRGLASFMQITRDDGTVDFGYMAVVRGDPKATTDTPDLMVYVIQDGKRAVSKGAKPIDRASFLALAEAVTRGVRRRVTQ